MDSFSAESFTATLAIIGVVVVVSALLSGLVERSGLPQVAVFLALGAVLGPAGLGLLDISLDSSALRVVATLSLALVLFTDAVSLNIAEVRRRTALALRLLGPGPALPEDAAENAQDGAHADRQAARGLRAASSPSSDGEDVAARSTDLAASCPIGAGGDGVQIGPQRISLEELDRLRQGKEPVTLLDVRTERSLEGEGAQAKGAVRVPPDHVAQRARELGLKKESWLIAYCA